jgi:hypothetical protein
MKKRNGSILVLAVVMVVTMLIIGLALIKLGSSARVQAIHSQLTIDAKTAADAGLTKAAGLMRKKLQDEKYAWINSTLPAEVNVVIAGTDPIAKYTFAVAGNFNNGWDIAATGTVGNLQRTVHKKVKVKSAWFGIGVEQGITIKSKVNFGSYPDVNVPLKIQTNSTGADTIGLFPNLTIPGDVVVGPGGDPANVIDTKSSTIINGNTYAAEEPIHFTPVDVPTDLTTLGVTPFPTGTGDVNITGDRHYSGPVDISSRKINIVGNSRIFIEGGKLTIFNSADLLVKAGGNLQLYMDGNVECKNGGYISNENSDARNLMLFGTTNCTSIILKAKSNSFLTVYAPTANLQIFNDGTFYGALVGKSLDEIKNSGTFYFDTRLLEILTGLTPPILESVQGSWWEE